MNNSSTIGRQAETEAAAILIESYSPLITPKIEALRERVAAIFNERIERHEIQELRVDSYLIPRDTNTFLNCAATTNQSHDESIHALAGLYSTQTFSSGYLFRKHGTPIEHLPSLALSIGGMERNQPFRGVFHISWTRGTNDSPSPPFPIPEKLDQLPGDESLSVLPLPPHFERTTRKEVWIALPAEIKRSHEWIDYEQTIAMLSDTGSKIFQRMIPLLSDAAWKSMATRVMHELSRTVSMPQPMLEEALKAVYSAHASLKKEASRIPVDFSESLINHLRTIYNNLERMGADQEYVISKVRWFFNLVADDLRSECPEDHSLEEIITQSVTALGRTPSRDLILQTPESPIWQCRLDMPKLFPQHCIEALLSNSLLHRDLSSPVIVSIEQDDKSDSFTMTWVNQATAEEAKQLEDELNKPVEMRSFGLRMMHSISESYFELPVAISITPEKTTHSISHRLSISSSKLVDSESSV